MARTASVIVTALESSTKVLPQVTSSGSFGSPGGGQNAALRRYTRNEPINPLKSINSDAISIRIASRPLLMNGCSRSASPEALGPVRPRRLTGGPSGLSLAAAAGACDAISVLHQNGRDRNRDQENRHSDQDKGRPEIPPALIAPRNDARHRRAHRRSSASTSS